MVHNVILYLHNVSLTNPGTETDNTAWCITPVGGAQCRSMVNNVVLYSLGGAQTQTDRQTNARLVIG